MDAIEHYEEPLRLGWNTLAGWHVRGISGLPDSPSERVDGVVEYVRADAFRGAVEALQAVADLAIRDPMPHSSAWLIPAGAMDLVRHALGGR